MESKNRPIWNCTRCGHQWFSHKDNKPVVCAACKNPYWDIPRKIESDWEVDTNECNERRNNKSVIED